MYRTRGSQRVRIVYEISGFLVDFCGFVWVDQRISTGISGFLSKSVRDFSSVTGPSVQDSWSPLGFMWFYGGRSKDFLCRNMHHLHCYTVLVQQLVAHVAVQVLVQVYCSTFDPKCYVRNRMIGTKQDDW